MKILALDTATENCSAALLVDGEVTDQEALLQRAAAERILPMVDELLRSAGVSLAQLDAIAFGRGPGGFTGVRLAASITQGLAYAAGVPVVPVSDLRALAQRALAAGGAARVLACADARMSEVYWGSFAADASGEAQLLGTERLGKPDAVQLPAPWQAAAEVAGAGSGFAAHPQLGARLGLPVHSIRADLLPRALEIVRLAVAEVRAGRVLPAELAIPVYLRDDVARPAASH
ncbi:MAG TPA: tRNA (adenosine(37)-N6)-threonylcarbamoyltransferase complex dimerization subunit type 1 TsaB [Steroidobacteraceae bacterium]|jgi:tRNA threonylcarbamoyladenosine biosynthesis protein TsaB